MQASAEVKPPTKIGDSFRRAIAEENGLAPELSSFSLQMISIGGAVGTGLFVASGKALSTGGPASLIICWSIIGTMIYCMTQSLAELAVSFPVPGAFSYYTCAFIDESWGFAMSINYAIQWLILLPLELSAASMLFKWWPACNGYEAIIMTVFFIFIIVANLMSVKAYGHVEVIFSMLKVVAACAFVIVGVVILFGGIPGQGFIGGRYWYSPGPFANGFKGVVKVFTMAAFSYSGTELVGLAACEAAPPIERQIPKASKQAFWRICTFYVVCLLVIGFLVPWNDPGLENSENSQAASPFVLALTNAGIHVVPSLMNGMILLAVLSVGISAIYACSRMLLALAKHRLLPTGKHFDLSYIDRQGRPLAAILFSLGFGLIAYISLISPLGAEYMFVWLMSLSGLASLFTWGSICLCHIRFREGLKAQNREFGQLKYASQTGVIGSWYGLTLNGVIFLAQVWLSISPVGGKPSAEGFFKNLLALPVIFLSYVLHKAVKSYRRGRVVWYVAAGEMDLDSFFNGGRLE